MELRFDAMLYSNLGNEKSDACHIKRSRGPQVPHPALQAQTSSYAAACRPLWDERNHAVLCVQMVLGLKFQVSKVSMQRAGIISHAC